MLAPSTTTFAACPATAVLGARALLTLNIPAWFDNVLTWEMRGLLMSS